MLDFLQQALNKADIGIIILDALQNIVFWNEEMEGISKISKQKAEGKCLTNLCPKFSDARYQNIFTSVMRSGQSRFCSGALHKAFVFPEASDKGQIRQNLKVDPIYENETMYLLLQITDITEQSNNEHKHKILIHELQKGYQSIKASEQAILEKAKYDMLTGVLNRQMLESELEPVLFKARQDSAKIALLFIDLDGFKKVNDQYGHVVGDVLLQQAAGRLISNTHPNESCAKDRIARIGGDEFLTWFEASEREFVTDIAQRIVSTLGKPYFIDNNNIQISVSMGIAIYPDDADSLQNLINCSDRAMYRIKLTTKNNFCFFSN